MERHELVIIGTNSYFSNGHSSLANRITAGISVQRRRQQCPPQGKKAVML
jgi:hypothetical protein